MLRTRNEILQTHLNETSDASPQAVIWQLAPTPRMRNTSLIHDASDEVHTYSDQSDDAKDSAWPKTLLDRLCCTAAR
jgi:hypothetical protein